jgi:nucleotide-binding universal stress UspA family protein
MISTILVAVDGSTHSMKALEFATPIAAAAKAKVVLLYVAKREEVPEAMHQFAKAEHFADRDADILEIMKASARQMLDPYAAELRAAGVAKVETEVREGHIARTIAGLAKQIKADMIVLGSRGMGDIEGYLRGGVSHRVEILADCPVLIVK